MPGALSEPDTLIAHGRFGRLSSVALLRRWKLVLAVVIGVLIAIYVLGYVLFSIGGTIPGSGEGDRVSLGSRP